MSAEIALLTCPFCGCNGVTKLNPSVPPTLEEALLLEPYARCSSRRCGGYDVQMTVSEWNDRPLLAEIATLSAQRDAMESALRFGIQEMTHDIPGSCWSTGPMTGTAEDDLCRGCLFLSKARTALASLEVTP